MSNVHKKLFEHTLVFPNLKFCKIRPIFLSIMHFLPEFYKFVQEHILPNVIPNSYLLHVMQWRKMTLSELDIRLKNFRIVILKLACHQNKRKT